ncbi:valine--tRNA ligase [Rickettsiales bacterium]|nr:valine--tRNA ligase [Rickettsiales bacterium]
MIEKRFNPDLFEKECLSYWQKNKKFKFKDSDDLEPYCIMMPPPNITGNLHIGHALTFSLQDILVRFQKKMGKSVLWQPGTDHAGIATEIIVEKNILNNGKEKKKIGREKFIEEVWKWKENSGSMIIEQLKRMGTSVDWDRSRFTMDEGLSKAVKHVFVKLYNEGIIYKDKRLVNWDPELKTAVSDLEVNQKEVNGKIWFLNYKIYNSDDVISIATTRPETIFADTAIAIHPKNNKLKKFIGQIAVIPILGKKIPIIGDSYADPEKGTGAVKITPGHDFNDFIVGKRNDLQIINIFDESACMNNNVPKKFIGLNRYLARKKIVEELKKSNQVIKIEDNPMTIPIGDRSGEVIEPLLTEQWYCDAKKLSKPIKKYIEKSKLNFHPSNWVNTFNNWIENIEPWCISRQIWWGHRIPAWYSKCGKIFVAENEKEAIQHAKEYFGKNSFRLSQDNDVLDTWFSSALWPFSTLGWPSKNSDLKRFYPTNVLITGFDIIFFWVARMVMMGIKFIGDIPFKNVYIHPLVKDENGKKMSKSKGNVIDPIKLIKVYGSDALRFTLVSSASQGRDIKLSNKLVETNRNFITKIWNVARFFEMNKFNSNSKFEPENISLDINHWIYIQFYETQKKVISYLEKFQFNYATDKLYQFIWNDFCDLYIELIKPYLKDKKYFSEVNSTFSWIFINILNLSNPFLPFITEEISFRLGFTKEFNLFEKNYQNLNKGSFEPKRKKIFDKLIIFIRDFRDFLTNKKLPNSYDLYVFDLNKVSFLEDNKRIIQSVFRVNEIIYNKIEVEKNADIFISSELKFGVIVQNKNSFEKLEEKVNFYRKEITFLSRNLNNDNFLKNAPKKIIDEQSEKLKSAKTSLELIENSIKNK